MANIEFFFAWIDPTETTFNPATHGTRYDENIYSLEIEHLEGQIPTAKLEVLLPPEGVLNPHRKQWAWLSMTVDGFGPTPLFFGRIVGIPTDLSDNTVMLNFITRRQDYIQLKQQTAETLKVLPNYDPLFFQISKRDDPDALLEGWSRLYHIDRVSGYPTTSDILVGEDGTVTFDPSDTFYDSVNIQILQSPLIAVNVKMEVTWEQQYRDFFNVGAWAWPTLGNDAFVQDWPKSGSNLGGGWTAGVSWAGERDPPLVDQLALTTQIGPYSYTYKWTNPASTHAVGDALSVSMSSTISGLPNHVLIAWQLQSGVVDQFAVDDQGNPAPIMIPMQTTYDYFDYRSFALDFLGKQSLATLGLVYQANRKRTERVDMTVTADTQAVLYEPIVTEDTDQISMSSGDLSQPFFDLLNWSSIGPGGSVEVGTFVFPDNPLVPGQTSTQIAVHAGTTGVAEPIFSNVAGQTTADGSVIWSSLGDTQPVENSQDWVSLVPISAGTILLPKPLVGVPDLNSIDIAGSLNYPPSGVPLSKYMVLSNGFAGPSTQMYEVTAAGFYGGLGTEPATLETFTNASGQHLFIAIEAGKTGEFHPTWNLGTGDTTTDGTVTWQCLGIANLPIGGSPGLTPAASYFTTDRGNQSLLHGMCRARAKLRKRARAIQVSFDTRFEVAAMLSCRMNGIVTDDRIPGGTAFGKVIGYKLTADGDTGQLKGNVTLGCSVGRIALT